MVPVAEATTPGSCRARSTIAKISFRHSAGSFLTRLKSNSAIKSPAGLKPGSSPAALSAPRKNNPAAKHNEQKSLAEQLTNNSPARCAHRQPNGNLFGTRGSAREEHVCQIQTCNKQHRSGHEHE